jgi:hypothetical protein
MLFCPSGAPHLAKARAGFHTCEEERGGAHELSTFHYGFTHTPAQAGERTLLHFGAVDYVATAPGPMAPIRIFRLRCAAIALIDQSGVIFDWRITAGGTILGDRS